MNIQDYIYNNLLTASAGSPSSKLKSILTRFIGGSTKVNIPVKNCHFIARIQGEDVILKKFTVPQIGITFNMSGGELCFPEPNINANQMELESYLMREDLENQSNFMKFYRQQFQSGLLSTRKRPDILIAVLLTDIDTDTKGLYDSLKASRLFAQTVANAKSAVKTVFSSDILNPVESITGVSTLEALGGAVTETADILSDESIEDEGRTIFPIVHMRDCLFDRPTMQADPSSNAFATLATKVSYYNSYIYF